MCDTALAPDCFLIGNVAWFGMVGKRECLTEKSWCWYDNTINLPFINPPLSLVSPCQCHTCFSPMILIILSLIDEWVWDDIFAIFNRSFITCRSIFCCSFFINYADLLVLRPYLDLRRRGVVVSQLLRVLPNTSIHAQISCCVRILLWKFFELKLLLRNLHSSLM